MLAKPNRITRKKEFDFIFLKGRSNHTPYFWIRSIKNNSGDFRLGVIVGGKTEKSAIKRNLLKRRIRSMVKNEAQRIKKGHDLVVVAKKETKNISFEELKKSLIEGLKSAGIYENL